MELTKVTSVSFVLCHRTMLPLYYKLEAVSSVGPMLHYDDINKHKTSVESRNFNEM